MTFPLYAHGFFGTYTGLLVGTLVGVAFGFVLERAGFGRARNLAAQFYLTDTRVLKVMFSAIVTALVGMAFLSGIGVLDLALITVPETFLWPQLVGGLILGAGFIVSGYCPGTGAVAIASGNVDGVAAIGGIMLGSLAFGFGYAPLEGFYKSGAMGVVRIDQLLGVPISVVAAAVVAMAVGAFLGAEKLEAIFAPRAGALVPASPARVKARVFSGFAAVAALALVALALPTRGAATPARSPQTIGPLELARELVARRRRSGSSTSARAPPRRRNGFRERWCLRRATCGRRSPPTSPRPGSSSPTERPTPPTCRPGSGSSTETSTSSKAVSRDGRRPSSPLPSRPRARRRTSSPVSSS